MGCHKECFQWLLTKCYFLSGWCNKYFEWPIFKKRKKHWREKEEKITPAGNEAIKLKPNKRQQESGHGSSRRRAGRRGAAAPGRIGTCDSERIIHLADGGWLTWALRRGIGGLRPPLLPLGIRTPPFPLGRQLFLLLARSSQQRDVGPFLFPSDSTL